MKIKFPENISYETEIVDHPFATPKVSRLIKSNFNGIVGADGKWKFPISDWQVFKKEDGKFEIKHNHGNKFYSASVSTLGAPANATIIYMDEYYLEVAIQDQENKPTTCDFALSVSFTDMITGDEKRLREG